MTLTSKLDSILVNDKTERERAFLEEYKKLIIKHQIYVSGCGCCDSPFLAEFVPEPTSYDPTPDSHIKHLLES